MQKRRHLLSALLVVALAATGCSTPQPTPTPTGAAEPTPIASTEPTPTPSAVAAEPTVVCQTLPSSHTPAPFVVTLTCENAVAAAKAVVGPDPTVTSIEFHFGLWCPPGYACLMIAVANGGYVVFHRKGGPDLVVIVFADTAGKVTASEATPILPRIDRDG